MFLKERHRVMRATLCVALLAGLIQGLGADSIPEFVPGEALVWFKTGTVNFPMDSSQGGTEYVTGSQEVQSFLQRIDADSIIRIISDAPIGDTLLISESGDDTLHMLDVSQVYRITFPESLNVLEVAESLQAFRNTIFAEPNYTFHTQKSPNDGGFSYQWALEQTNDCDIDATTVWDYQIGSNKIRIGIVDLGVDYRHQDLGGKSSLGYKVVDGYDYLDNDSDPKPNCAGDGHGTEVAGIAGALTNNNKCIAGIAGGWGGSDIGCELIALRCGTKGVIKEGTAVKAIWYGAKKYKCNVENASFGWLGRRPEILRSFIRSAVYRYNTVFVAAKGNDNTSKWRHYPPILHLGCFL